MTAAARVKPTLLTKEIADLRSQLAAAVAEASALRAELASEREHLAVVAAHEQDLVRDAENLSDALAECVLLLDRCVAPRFRDRELQPLLKGYRLLAGAAAYERVLGLPPGTLPSLGTPTSAFDPPSPAKCGDPPPKLATETHLPCKWTKGHGGDHFWPARDEQERAITGQVPR